MIFLLLQTVLGNQLFNLTTHTLYNKLQESDPIEVVVNEQHDIRDYSQAKFVINEKLESLQKGSVCYVKQGSIKFGDYNSFSQKVFPYPQSKSNDPEYYLNIPVLLNMVHIKHAFAMVTSDHQMLIYKISIDQSSITGHSVQLTANHSFASLRKEAQYIEVPQIVYSKQNQYIYLIYRDQVIGGKVNYDNLKSFTLRNITTEGLENFRNYIGQVKTFGWHLFVPLGTDGLDVYQCEENGNLILQRTFDASSFQQKKIKQIKLVDVTFGGNSEQQYMYILDELNGVSRFTIKSLKNSFEQHLDESLGLITFQNGKTIAEYNDNYLLVLCETGVVNYLIEIALFHTNWFKVKIHFLTGKYYEIDILPQFALLRGKDEHRIIRTGVYEKFEPQFMFVDKDNLVIERSNSFYEEYAFIPHLITMDFYDINVGELNVTNNFNYNITNSFLVGITAQSIVYIPYFIENPFIRCNPLSKRSIGRTFSYKLTLNATHCPSKDKMTGIPQQLILCQYEDEFSILVTNGDGRVYDTESLASIVMGFIVLVIVLSILLAYLYSRYRIQNKKLQSEIQGFGESQHQEGYNMEHQDQ